MRLSPEDPAIPFAFAVSILAVDSQEFQDDGVRLLKVASDLADFTPQSRVSQKISSSSKSLLEALETGRVDDAQAMAISIL